MAEHEQTRRPVRSRSTRWAARVASLLAGIGVSPNQISVASMAFAATGAALLLYSFNPYGLLACALAIQARLLCNLFDGMVAIESGKMSPLGPIYNEVPDRLADSVLIVASGYAVGLAWLGWLGALAAALTAYIRVFSATLGFAQNFRGPMAKQHRMAVLTVGCLLGAIEYAWTQTPYAMRVACVVVAAGSLVTCFTRLESIAMRLRLSRD